MRPHFDRILFVAICLASPLLAHVAAAQPIPPLTNGSVQLAWNSCFVDGGAYNKSFACDTNSGSATLVVSVSPPQDIPQLNGFVCYIDILSPSSTFPNWWQMQTGGCRAGLMSHGFERPPGALGCNDLWQGAVIGGSNFSSPGIYVNSGRIAIVASRSPTTLALWLENYFLATISFPYASSTGSGACDGCASGVCLGIRSILLTQPNSYLYDEYRVLTPAAGTNSDLATWQPGVVMRREWYFSAGSGYYKSFSCLSETEVKRPTWGTIKRMYR